ncbi:MAG: hypothetical protein LBI64_02390 [Coriobacteriales bacterium]|jgi:hypothetical protein|nr:hypothetical protein [Coriobacteriales bacterium]
MPEMDAAERDLPKAKAETKAIARKRRIEWWAVPVGLVCLAALIVACLALPQPWQQSTPVVPPTDELVGEISPVAPEDKVATTDCLLISVECEGWKTGDIRPLVSIEQTAPVEKIGTVALDPGEAVDVADLEAGTYRISLIAPVLSDGTMFAPVSGYTLTIGKATGGEHHHVFTLTALTDGQMKLSALDEVAAALGIEADHAAYKAAKVRIDAAVAAGASADNEDGSSGGSGGGGSAGATGGGSSGSAGATGGGGSGSSGGGGSTGSDNGNGSDGGVTPPPPVEVVVWDYYCSCGARFGSQAEVEAHIDYYQQLFLDWQITVEEARQHSGWRSSWHYEYQ